MARGRARGGRSLSLGGLVAVLLLLGAVVLLERYDLLPHGTLDSIFGTEEQPRRERATRHPPQEVRPQPRPAPTRPAPDDAVDYEQTQARLDAIRVEPEMRRGYRRDDWPHWLDLDNNCLNTREEVLIRDAAEPPKRSPDGCSILSGVWHDPYTGETFTDPRRLDIDHRVPLEEAFGSGGHAWTREQRAAYANDLTDPLTLIAVSAAANRAKGAKGPEEWLPPNGSYICRYVADWIEVKAHWHLAMDERERVTVGNILADCRGQVAERR